MHYEQECCANMITKEEIESEIDFFQLKITPQLLPILDPYIEMLNKFIGMIESLISTAKGIYICKINITFPCHDKDGFFVEPKIKMLNEIIEPFSDCGLYLLQNMVKNWNLSRRK